MRSKTQNKMNSEVLQNITNYLFRYMWLFIVSGDGVRVKKKRTEVKVHLIFRIKYLLKMDGMMEEQRQKAPMEVGRGKASVSAKTEEIERGLQNDGFGGIRSEDGQKDIQVNQRQTYQSQPVRAQGAGKAGKIGQYGAEDHRRL